MSLWLERPLEGSIQSGRTGIKYLVGELTVKLRGLIEMANFLQALVRGFTWKARMSNDAVFSFWTPFDITRREARKRLLKESNGDCEGIYEKSDVCHVWRTIGRGV